ncbi:MAG TPA: FecR domain-containing protein [Candidatus Limnocylindrales bacterium]|nr:FecR domain-containing protein [Candidatus Limnocylindrales bacterium]
MQMSTKLALLLILAAPIHALAAEPIGYVKTATGATTVVRGGAEQPIAVGDPVFENDTIKTRAESSLGVTLKDGTTLAAGPDTVLSLDDYAYAPHDQQLGLIARVSQGTLDFVSGLIGKMAPETVSVVTPTGVIGLRGTHFVVKVAPGQKFAEVTEKSES